MMTRKPLSISQDLIYLFHAQYMQLKLGISPQNNNNSMKVQSIQECYRILN